MARTQRVDDSPAHVSARAVRRLHGALRRARLARAALLANLESGSPPERGSRCPPHRPDAGEGSEFRDDVAAATRAALAAAEAALRRIEDGTYGRCTSCGDPIPLARLAALPDAPHCVACAHRHAARRVPSTL